MSFYRSGYERDDVASEIAATLHARAPGALSHVSVNYAASAGHVVGIVDIVGVLDPADNTGRWSKPKHYGLKLANPRSIDRIPCVSNQGLPRVNQCKCGYIVAIGAQHSCNRKETT